MPKIELIATATFGLEAVVAREVRELGYPEVTVENGRVLFQGDLEAICRTNLWLRSADRVLLKVGEFSAASFTELFDQTKALPWSEWLPEDAAFPVQGKSVRSTLFSVSDCQAIVKKAIVESLKNTYAQEWFPETGPIFPIEVALLKDVVTLTIDTSGIGLHKRGYRKLASPAPIKETLAAALVQLSRWYPDQSLLDPCCGSGTIPIEAALIGLNLAPGLYRSFCAEQWPWLPIKYWDQAREEAQDLVQSSTPLAIRGTDIDPAAIRMARYHAEQAGLKDRIHWQQMPLNQLKTKQKYGRIICNPPYGQRLEDQASVEQLYQEMGRLSQELDTWSFFILTAYPQFETLFGRRATKNRKLYNGRIQCRFYQFLGPRVPRLSRLSPEPPR